MRLLNKYPTITSGGVDYTNTTIIQYSDKWVIAQRDELSIAVQSGLLLISYDNSITFPVTKAFANADKVINGYVFRNGNIMLSTIDNKIYLTNYNLDFITEKIVYKADGVTPYPIHVPQEALNPGRYFYTHKYMESTEATDIYIFGNYCNVNNGAAPVIMVYTADFGVTWKISYEFGQLYRDNGGSGGSTTIGTLLGDVNNPVLTRHTHHVEYSPENNKWYCFTGDHNSTEIHWLEGVYDEINDIWTWVVINFNITITEQSRLKSTEMSFYNEYLYYCTDSTGISVSNDENGIWRVPINSIADINTHVKIIDFPDYRDVCSNLKIDKNSGNILFTVITESTGDTDTIGIATNFGEGEVQYKTFPGMAFIRLNSPNSAGFFRLDTNRTLTLQNKSFLIKVGFDLFNNM